MLPILQLAGLLLVTVAGVCHWIWFVNRNPRVQELAGYICNAGVLLAVLHFVLDKLG